MHLFILFIFFNLSSLYGEVGFLNERSDLNKASQSLCGAALLDQTNRLRELEVWDLHVQGGVISAPNARSAKEYVKKYARKNRHLGYNIQTCAKGKNRYGFLTTFAPISPKEWSAKKNKSFCQDAKITYAPLKIGGIPSTQKAPIRQLNKGRYTSIYCNNGGKYRETYLIEPNKKLSQKQFYSKVPGQSPEKTLGNLRLRAKRTKVSFSPLPEKLRDIILDGTIDHSAHTPGSISTVFGAGMFVGEVKVFAKNWQEALWSLWRSPSHRKILYHKKVKKMYLAKRPLNKKPGLFQFAIIALR